MSQHHGKWEAAKSFFTVVWGDRYDWEDGQHHSGTPQRWVKMMLELTTPEEFEFTTFTTNSDEMVIVKDIPFVSLCAHHMVPFTGVCHIGYVPDSKIAGLSKFARLVRAYSKDLTVQEELTQEIARGLERRLQPKGVAVVMIAEHMCMTIRGVQTPGTKTITSKMTGVFADHNRQARNEFLSMIKDH